MKHVEIFCKNTETNHTYPLGTSLLEICKQLEIETEKRVCGAIVNNQVRELSFCLVKPKQIEFFDNAAGSQIKMLLNQNASET